MDRFNKSVLIQRMLRSAQESMVSDERAGSSIDTVIERGERHCIEDGTSREAEHRSLTCT